MQNASENANLLEGRAAGVDLMYEVLDTDDAVLAQSLHSNTLIAL